MTAAEHAVEAHGLVKHFKNTKAVDGVDLAVPTGTVLGLLGPNGAGKTTTVRILATLLRPDAGTARILGHDVLREPDAVRSIVGLTGQFASVDEDLTGAENLRLVARLYGFSWAQARARTDELLSAFELTADGNRQVKTYSGGMRRRIDLAASMIISPRVLFLDEPTTGLDPRSRGQVWEIVRLLVADGATVLLTTQYLDEADQLAHRICVIDQGVVIAQGTPGQLKASVGTGALLVRVVDPVDRPAAADVVARVLGTPVELAGDVAALAARIPDDDDASQRAAALLPALLAAGVEIAEFSLGQPSLDEVFLALTGRRAQAEVSGPLDGEPDPESSGTGPDGNAEEVA